MLQMVLPIKQYIERKHRMISFKEYLELKEKKKKKKTESKINNPVSGGGGGNVVRQDLADQPDQTDQSSDSHYFPEP